MPRYLKYGSASVQIPEYMVGVDRVGHQHLYPSLTTKGHLSVHGGVDAIGLSSFAKGTHIKAVKGTLENYKRKANKAWHDRYVDPSRRSGHRSRAFCSRAGGAAAMWEGPMPARGSSSSQNPNTQATHAGPKATPRPTHGLCATRGTDPGRPGRQARRRTLTAREPNTLCAIGQLRIPLTARAPPGVLTRRTAHTDGLCANHLGLRHRR